MIEIICANTVSAAVYRRELKMQLVVHTGEGGTRTDTAVDDDECGNEGIDRVARSRPE